MEGQGWDKDQKITGIRTETGREVSMADGRGEETGEGKRLERGIDGRRKRGERGRDRRVEETENGRKRWERG